MHRILTFVLLCVLYASATASATITARWCVITRIEMKKCQAMKSVFVSNKFTTNVDCVQGKSTIDCMQKIHAQQADIITLDGGSIFTGGSQYNLVPILAENYGLDTGASYYAVAVVRNGSPLTMHNLQGAKSCHTGIDKTSGWNVPVGYLIEHGFIKPNKSNCDIPLRVGNFFSKSCVPGALLPKYNPHSTNPTSLCALCIGDVNGNSKCARDHYERYYGYGGAFRCLAERSGDVAFVKQSTVFENTDGNSNKHWTKSLNSSDYLLLCKNGTTANLSDYKSCNLARVPAHAVVVAAKTSPATRQQYINMLLSAQKVFNQSSTFKLFNSDTYGDGMHVGSDLLFKDSTKNLDSLGTNATYISYLGAEYVAAVSALQNCPKPLRFCTISSTEMKKCKAMETAVSRHVDLFPYIDCVSGTSVSDCMEKIHKNEADIVDIDTSDLVTGGEKYNLMPIMAENSGEDIGISYYSVAVARKESTFTLKSMRGVKSCHTGINKTSGWNIPVGYLLEKGIMPRNKGCDVPGNVGAFFEKSCAPGALSPKYNTARTNPSNLCDLCIGDNNGNNKCVRNQEERYYSYDGAFRCLAEKSGDVAFIKHSTVLDNTNGKNTAQWASTLKSSDYQLLCEDGKRKTVAEFSQCNLARVPAHAIVTSSLRPILQRASYVNMLQRMQIRFGSSGTDKKSFRMFSSKEYATLSGSPSIDLIFKDSTLKLDVLGTNTTYQTYLGSNFIHALDAVQQCTSSALSTFKTSFNMFLLNVVIFVCYLALVI